MSSRIILKDNDRSANNFFTDAPPEDYGLIKIFDDIKKDLENRTVEPLKAPQDQINDIAVDTRPFDQREDIPEDYEVQDVAQPDSSSILTDIANNKFVSSFGKGLGGVKDFAVGAVTHPIDTAESVIKSPFESALSGLDEAIGGIAGAGKGMGLESAPYVQEYAPELASGPTEGIKSALKVGLPLAAPGSEFLSEPLGKLAEGNVQEGLGELAGLGVGGALLHGAVKGVGGLAGKIPVESLTEKLPLKYNPTTAGMGLGGFEGSGKGIDLTKPVTLDGQSVNILNQKGRTVLVELPDGTKKTVGISRLSQGEKVLEKFPQDPEGKAIDVHLNPELQNKLQDYRQQVNLEDSTETPETIVHGTDDISKVSDILDKGLNPQSHLGGQGESYPYQLVYDKANVNAKEVPHRPGDYIGDVKGKPKEIIVSPGEFIETRNSDAIIKEQEQRIRQLGLDPEDPNIDVDRLLEDHKIRKLQEELDETLDNEQDPNWKPKTHQSYLDEAVKLGRKHGIPVYKGEITEEGKTIKGERLDQEETPTINKSLNELKSRINDFDKQATKKWKDTDWYVEAQTSDNPEMLADKAIYDKLLDEGRKNLAYKSDVDLQSYISSLPNSPARQRLGASLESIQNIYDRTHESNTHTKPIKLYRGGKIDPNALFQSYTKDINVARSKFGGDFTEVMVPPERILTSIDSPSWPKEKLNDPYRESEYLVLSDKGLETVKPPTISPEDVSLVAEPEPLENKEQFSVEDLDALKQLGGKGNKPPNEPPSSPPSTSPYPKGEYGQVDKLGKSLADFVGLSKRTVMSTGVPGTGINPHGFSTLARSVGKETPGSIAQIQALGKTARYMVQPSEAVKYLTENKADLDRFNELTNDKFAGAEELSAKDKHGKLSEMFETPLFRKIIPALKLEQAQGLEKRFIEAGMDKEKATNLAIKQASETFGGLNNWSRSNVARIVLFAPDWLETNQKIAKGFAKTLKDPTSAEGKLYRNLVGNAVALYTLKYASQKMFNQGSQLENQPGHESDVKVGHDKEGREIYVRPEATGADFARIPYEAALAVSHGNLEQLRKQGYNRLSPPMRIAVDLMSNTDFAGRPLYGKDKYGKEIPLINSGTTKTGKPVLSTARRVANEAAGVLPGPIQAIMNAIQSVKGYDSFGEEAMEVGSRSIGLPVSIVSPLPEPKKKKVSY